MSEAEWRRGVIAFLSAIEARAEDAQASLGDLNRRVEHLETAIPSEERQHFEDDVWLIAKTVRDVALAIRRIVLFLRKTLLAVAPVIAAYVMFRSFLYDEYRAIADWWASLWRNP